MLEIFKCVGIILEAITLCIFIGVIYIISKQEDRKGLGLALFIAATHIYQIIYLLLL